MHQILLKKLIDRPRVGIFKDKQLEKLGLGEDFKTATKFTERNIGKCHKTAVK